jgi:hypothetical protein
MKSFGTKVHTRILGTQSEQIFDTEIRTDFCIDINTENAILIPTNAQ